MSNKISSIQRKALSEVNKLLNQVSKIDIYTSMSRKIDDLKIEPVDKRELLEELSNLMNDNISGAEHANNWIEAMLEDLDE